MQTRKHIYKILSILFLLLILSLSSCSQSRIPVYPNYILDWSDEFNKTAIDTAKWQHIVAGGGFGNNELQFYTNKSENSRIENGRLIIEAHRQKTAGWPYSSAKLQTLGRYSFQYGRVDVRAKIPQGRGSWPAIWLLPENSTQYGIGWPDSGEIDIMEHVGYEPGVIHSTVHTNAYNHRIGTQRGNSSSIPDFSDNFHVYSLEWTPDKIIFYIDNEQTYQFENEKSGWQSWPFDQPFYLILNIACGGDWGGREGIDNTSLPWRMEIDWVRVYKKKK